MPHLFYATIENRLSVYPKLVMPHHVLLYHEHDALSFATLC